MFLPVWEKADAGTQVRTKNLTLWDIPEGDLPLSPSLATNEQTLRTLFALSFDLVFRPLDTPEQPPMLLVFVDGLIDYKRMEEAILPYLASHRHAQADPLTGFEEIVGPPACPAAQVVSARTVGQLARGILNSQVAVLSEGETSAVLMNMVGFSTRGIQEPTGETVVRGPREGFVENLRTNTSMLRRRLKTYRLKMEPMTIGEGSQTEVVIAYVEGVANEAVLRELRQRLQTIRMDAVTDSLFLEECLEDNPYSPFPQIQNTERPDVVTMALLEGRVSVLVDGSPQALVIPMTLWYGMQTAQDYYERWIFVSAIRLLRLSLLFLSVALTPFYVAVVTFHPQLLPIALLLSVAAAREPNPFPTLTEAFLMEFIFEGLREAGIRLPQNIGAAVSIVGGVVVGQAAIDAGFLTAPLVIVVATSGIASFSIPQYNLGLSFRMLRFAILFAAGTMGLYGFSVGMLAIFIHLVHLRSFGVPYLSPVAPDSGLADLRDILVRAPRWLLAQSRGYLADDKTPPHGGNPRLRKRARSLP